MDANQLGRRNLTPDQRKIIIGRRYNREKLKGFKGNQYTTLVDDKLSTTKTADKLADENNISDRTVIRYAKEAETFDKIKTEQPELAQKVWSGETTLKELIGERKKQNYDKKKNEFDEPIKINDCKSILINGDCIDVLKTTEQINADLFLSDPPYAMDFKSGWNDWAKIAGDKRSETINLLNESFKEVKRH